MIILANTVNLPTITFFNFKSANAFLSALDPKKLKLVASSLVRQRFIRLLVKVMPSFPPIPERIATYKQFMI